MATWFAQNSSVNIDSVGQWNSVAAGGGTVLTWASLAAGDILVANGKTAIAINVSFTCSLITTAATGGTAGGGFICTASGITVTSAVTAGTTACLVFSHLSGTSYIVGAVTSANALFAYGINNSGSGTVQINGNVRAVGANNGGHGVNNAGSGAVTIIGSVTGGGSSHFGVNNASVGTVTVIGNVNAGNHLHGNGITNAGAGIVYITGNVSGPQVAGTAFGILNNSSGTVNITGNCTGGISSIFYIGYAVNNAVSGTVNITGNCLGGNFYTAPAVTNSGSGNITIIGTLTASSAASALLNYGSGRVIHYGNQIADASGQSAISGAFVVHATDQLTHTYRLWTGTVVGAARSLYTGGVNLGQPVVANVRSGTTYGVSSEYTGTLAVPSPTLVAIGVSTDNTVGSYSPSVNASDIRSAVGLAAANLDTQLSGIQSDTDDIQTRLPASLNSGRIVAMLESNDKNTLVDLIWDEILTGATHNVATSAGRRLRQANAFQQIDATINDASATTTSFITTLSSSVDDFYNDSMIVFIDGALAGQVRPISDYIGSTKTIILEEASTSAPANGVAFTIISIHVHPISQIQNGLSTLTANQVNAEVLDVLTVDTFSELAAPPTATSSLKDKITWIFMWARNKISQSQTERKLYADNDSTVVSTESTVDNANQFTKGKTL